MLDAKTSGWRVFALDGDRLIAPFAARYWSDRLTEADAWTPGANRARCLESNHEAPTAACTCGIRATVELSRLLEAVTTRHFAGSERTVLEDAPVIALVDLDGSIERGVDMPGDDPHTTVRAAVATMRELHVGPRGLPFSAKLRKRYGVPVRVWKADEWPTSVRSLDDWFLERLHKRGFGNRDTVASADAFVKIARDAAATVLAGTTAMDLATVLYNGDPHVTWEQAKGFIRSALEVYDPPLLSRPDGIQFGTPPTKWDNMGRNLARATSVFGGGR
ncbi:MAG: DUF732 domain-containing protein [Motilibacteraceae bacterium]